MCRNVVLIELLNTNRDEGVNFAVQKGVQISRSAVRYFRHNDMQDLERVLMAVQQEDKKACVHPRLLLSDSSVIELEHL